jgi:dTDP-N-acetylfucosamine:lipid II N-acetylfucosaminyltransferase
VLLKFAKKLRKLKCNHFYYWHINKKTRHYKVIHLMFNDKFNQAYVEFLNRNFDINKHGVLCKRWFDKFPFPSGSNVFELSSFKKIDLKSCDKIILHSLFDNEVVDILYENPKLLKKSTWVMWGGDLYNPPRDEKHDFVRKNCKEYVNMMDKEYAIKKYGMEGAFHDVHYVFPISKSMLDAVETKKQPKLRIQINNSADISTLAVLDMLSKFKELDIQITTVLSYGDMSQKELIIDKGEEIFGDKFEYLDQFLDPRDYLQHLANIDVLILNQDRQQGFGNTITAIYLGKKVFIKKKVSVYSYLNRNNINVFSSDKITDMSFTTFIQNDSKDINIMNISKYIDEDCLKEAWVQVF